MKKVMNIGGSTAMDRCPRRETSEAGGEFMISPKNSIGLLPGPNRAERPTMRSVPAAFVLALTFATALGQQPARPSPKPATAAPSPQRDSNRAALIARAKSLELDTPYLPPPGPPGNPLVHHAAGFAKVMCSAAFVRTDFLVLRLCVSATCAS